MNIKNFIDGEYINPVSNKWLDNYNPATGNIYGKIPNSNKGDVDLAVKASEKAFKKWANTDIEIRSTILSKIADLLEKKLDEFAKAESKDNGKPVSLAKSVDIPRASNNFRFFAHAITQFGSESYESIGKRAINYTLRHPVGIVACISPWNLPLYLFTWKIAPALASGNCVVAKPSEITPMTAYLLGKICNEAGLPKGVLNIVHGLGNTVGNAIINNDKIKAISFTGGTKTGAIIAKETAPKFKKLSLELGGKNPNIIFADCNYKEMLETTIKSSFANQGQICLCGSRIFIEKSIYLKFKRDFIEAISKLKVGNPENKDTNIGALVSKEHLEKVLNYVKIAKKDGAKVLTGGNRVEVKGFEKGYYMQPTILEISDNKCIINQEEVFGPLVTIMSFNSTKEVIEMANDVKYGLSATIWTNNLERTMQLTQEIQAGIIWINTWMLRDLRTPFGGTKDSGVGREGGFEALRFFTEPKNVCIKY